MTTATAKSSSRWTGLVGRGLRVRLARRIRLLDDLDYWRENSALIQRRQLRWLLEAASETEFGRSHRFGRLSMLGDSELLDAYRTALDAEVEAAELEQRAREAEIELTRALGGINR